MLSVDYPIDSDYWNYLHCLFSGLDPHLLRKAIYPLLTSWGAVNNLSTQNIPLSYSSVLTSGCKLFLLDSFFVIIAYFNDTDGKSEGITFPPPKDSKK